MTTYSLQNFFNFIGVSMSIIMLSSCASLEKLDRGLYSGVQKVTQENVVTGERSLNFSSRQQQIKKGNSIMDEIVGKYSTINRQVDSSAYSRLVRIFNRVHTVTHYANENWEVLLLPDDSFNAFVTGGTYVAVNIGLMDRLHEDSAVAAVIGHEIAHVAANHVFDKQSALINLAAGDKTVAGFDYGYSALKEEEADKIGAVYTALAGYDPRAVAKVWQEFSKSGDDWSYFRTHPASYDRAKTNRILGEVAKEYYVPGVLNPDYRKLSRCNKFWCNR